MDTNIFNFVRDVLVIGYMFVLRLGVPLLIVVFWGLALKKWLDKPTAEVTVLTPVKKPESVERTNGDQAPVILQ